MNDDLQVEQDVLAELARTPALRGAKVRVTVRIGVVKLDGEVGSYAERLEAEHASHRADGVRILVNEIVVRLAQASRRADADICQSATRALQYNSSLPAGAVTVSVINGWLTLSGDVPWQYQRQAAQNCLRYQGGLTGITNLIAIRQAAPAGKLNTHMQAAFGNGRQRSIQADGHRNA